MRPFPRRSFLASLAAGIAAPFAGLFAGRAKAAPDDRAEKESAGAPKPATPMTVGVLYGRAVAIPAGSEADYPGFERLIWGRM